MSAGIVQVNPGDRGRVAAFFSHFHPGQVVALDSPVYGWQVSGNPANPGGVPQGWLVELSPGGEVVAYLDSLPTHLEADGRRWRASWIMSLLVRPDFQSRGLPPWLIRAWMGTVEIGLAFGGTPDSRAFLVRSGWKDLGIAGYFRRPLHVGSFIRDKVPGPMGKVLARGVGSPVSRLLLAPRRPRRGEAVLGWPGDAELDELWARSAPALGVAVPRDSGYLRWRYRERPGDAYEVLALRVDGRLEGVALLRERLKRGKRLGLLVDLWGVPEHGALLLAHASYRFRQRGADAVHVYTPHAGLSGTLKAHGFFRRPTTLHLLYGLGAGVTVPEPLFGDAARWWVTQADGGQDRF